MKKFYNIQPYNYCLRSDICTFRFNIINCCNIICNFVLTHQKLLRLLLPLLVIQTISIHLPWSGGTATFINNKDYDNFADRKPLLNRYYESTSTFSKSLDDDVANVEKLRTKLSPHDVQTLQKNFDEEMLNKIKADAVTTETTAKHPELSLDEIFGSGANQPPIHIMRKTQGVCLKFGRMCSQIYEDWLKQYQRKKDYTIDSSLTTIPEKMTLESSLYQVRAKKPTGEELRHSAIVISLKEEIQALQIMISRFKEEAHLEKEEDILVQLYLQNIVVDVLLYISQVNFIMSDVVIVCRLCWEWLLSICSVALEYVRNDNGSILYESFSTSTLKLGELLREYSYGVELEGRNPMIPSGKAVWLTEVVITGICGASVIIASVVWLIADGNDEFLSTAQSHNSMKNALYTLRLLYGSVRRRDCIPNNDIFTHEGDGTTRPTMERLDGAYNVILLYRRSLRIKFQTHTFFILRVEIICCVLTILYITSLGISLQSMVRQSTAGNLLGWLVSESTLEACLYAAAFILNVPSICLLVSTASSCHQKLMNFEEAVLLSPPEK